MYLVYLSLLPLILIFIYFIFYFSCKIAGSTLILAVSALSEYLSDDIIEELCTKLKFVTFSLFTFPFSFVHEFLDCFFKVFPSQITLTISIKAEQLHGDTKRKYSSIQTVESEIEKFMARPKKVFFFLSIIHFFLLSTNSKIILG